MVTYYPHTQVLPWLSEITVRTPLCWSKILWEPGLKAGFFPHREVEDKHPLEAAGSCIYALVFNTHLTSMSTYYILGCGRPTPTGTGFPLTLPTTFPLPTPATQESKTKEQSTMGLSTPPLHSSWSGPQPRDSCSYPYHACSPGQSRHLQPYFSYLGLRLDMDGPERGMGR